MRRQVGYNHVLHEFAGDRDKTASHGSKLVQVVALRSVILHRLHQVEIAFTSCAQEFYHIAQAVNGFLERSYVILFPAFPADYRREGRD